MWKGVLVAQLNVTVNGFQTRIFGLGESKMEEF